MLTVDTAIYDVDQRKAAYHLMGEAETPVGLYSNEYSIFLSFTEDGTKLTKVVEMVDSAYIGVFTQKMKEHFKSGGQR